MNMDVHYSSKKDDWETPQELFNLLDSEFHFTLDVCATKENAKCEKFYTIDDNGIDQPWDKDVCWMNPPYGNQIGAWVERAYYTGWQDNGFVCCLLPARTDTRWWWNFCARAEEIRFLKGRLKFGGHKNSAPFPSAVVLFSYAEGTSSNNFERRPLITSWWDWKTDGAMSRWTTARTVERDVLAELE